MQAGHGAGRSQQDLAAEVESLTTRLREAEELIRAIQSGAIDALVVPGSDGDRVFTLTGSDHAYRIIIEAMSECALTIAGDGAILYCNRHTSELFELPFDQITGSSIRIFLANADVGRFDSLLMQAAEAPAKGELVLQSARGRKVPVICSLSSLSPHGIPAFCLVITDLTEQKRSQELMEMRERLAAKAAELERSNDDLKQFAMVASHDLQEPLRMITSYLGLLDRRYASLFDTTAKSYLTYAIDGAQRLSVMIKSLLAYSSLSSKPMCMTDLALEDPVHDAIGNLAETIAERSAVVTWGSLPTVRADRIQLARLLQNLIGNGIKFSRGTPAVRIEAYRGEGEWIISVTDNGIGIPEEKREVLFQMFQRLHSSEEFPGSGIGLATCRRIIERHGGRIWFESQPGAGSTFRFSLPA